MLISIVVHSRGTITHLKHIISCFQSQTHQERELVFVIDEHFTTENYNHWLAQITDNQGQNFLQKNNIRVFTLLDSKFIPHNVSSMRNFAIQQAKGEFLNLMDDDEDFPSDYLEKSIKYREKYLKQYQKDIIITPTLMYRHTGQIQNQGFSSFNYWLSRPIPCVLYNQEYAEIQLYSGNSLFAPAHIFKQTKMDERFDFVYEDLDYSHTLYKQGHPIIVLRDLKIYHMEREKNILEQARVGNPQQAYKKAKHRMFFVKKHATLLQKIQFYCLGFRGQPLRLSLKVMLFGKRNEIWSIIKSIWKGTI